MNSSSVENQKKPNTFIYLIVKNYNHCEQKKNLRFDSREKKKKKLRGSFTYYSELFAVNIAQTIAATKESDSRRFLEKNGEKTNKKKHNGVKLRAVHTQHAADLVQFGSNPAQSSACTSQLRCTRRKRKGSTSTSLKGTWQSEVPSSALRSPEV